MNTKRAVIQPSFITLPDAKAAPSSVAAGASRIVDGKESGWKLVELPSNASAVKAFATERAWSGIDVFMGTPFVLGGGAMPAGSFVRVHVYASIIGGPRALVATGAQRSGITGDQRWICSARAICDKFEVELSFSTLIGTSVMVPMGYQATDQEADAPLDIGQIPVAALGSAQLETAANSMTLVPSNSEGWELCALQATAAVAARWLHVHDQPNVGAAIGAAPRLSYGLPVVGSTLSESLPSALFRTRRFTQGIVIAVSTNALTTVLGAGGDVAFNGWVR